MGNNIVLGGVEEREQKNEGKLQRKKKGEKD